MTMAHVISAEIDARRAATLHAIQAGSRFAAHLALIGGWMHAHPQEARLIALPWGPRLLKYVRGGDLHLPCRVEGCDGQFIIAIEVMIANLQWCKRTGDVGLLHQLTRCEHHHHAAAAVSPWAQIELPLQKSDARV